MRVTYEIRRGDTSSEYRERLKYKVVPHVQWVEKSHNPHQLGFSLAPEYKVELDTAYINLFLFMIISQNATREE